MTNRTNPGDPAFPTTLNDAAGLAVVPGMNLRQYAAITLKVPNSGTDWLDDMIRASVRDELAAKAMQAAYQPFSVEAEATKHWTIDGVAESAYAMADAMLEARKGS